MLFLFLFISNSNILFNKKIGKKTTTTNFAVNLKNYQKKQDMQFIILYLNVIFPLSFSNKSINKTKRKSLV